MNKISRQNVELPITALKPYARNSRTHSANQIKQIAASMKEWGFTNPCLIDENGGIIAGHGRVLGAEKAGITSIPCVRLTGLSEAQKSALVIADNKLALNAGWDDEILKSEIGLLNDVGFDLTLLGFSDSELGIKVGLVEEDEIPESAPPRTVLGDVWQLGPHRVMCGDSTSVTAVDTLLAGKKPHLMVTDPPYGVEYDANWRNEADRANGKAYGASAVGKVENDSRADWSEAWALFPGHIAYVWHAGNFAGTVQKSLEDNGFKVRAQIIWAKSNFAIGRGDYHWKHEPCWYAVKGTGKWTGDRKQTTVWEIDKPQKSETGHSTQKPVECMRRPMLNNSDPGDSVYDPFLGSGTTIIAAESTGRVCYGMELNPAYVDIIVKRWEEFTGKTATLGA